MDMFTADKSDANITQKASSEAFFAVIENFFAPLIVCVIYMLYICTTNIIQYITMAIGIERKQTAFRLSTSLLNKLREAADRENRSLNNYVESVLMDAVNNNPNKLTLAAMKEARENRDLETLDANNLDSVIASL